MPAKKAMQSSSNKARATVYEPVHDDRLRYPESHKPFFWLVNWLFEAV
jgi:hypothetical protein